MTQKSRSRRLGVGGGLQRLIPAETRINVGLWGGGRGAGLAQTCRTCRSHEKAQDLQEWQADAGEGAGGAGIARRLIHQMTIK